MFLKKLFNTILNFGVETGHPAHDRRRIKTTNLLNLVIVFFLLIGYTNYFILKTDFALIPVSTFLVLALLSLFLNKYNKNKCSFLLFTFNVNLSIFFINQYYPHEVGAYLFYFPLIVSVVLLNNPSFKDRYALMHFSICAFFFITNLTADFPDFEIKTLSASQMKTLWYYDLVMAASITAVLSFLLSRLIFNQNKEIILQNNDLKTAKEAINVSLKEKEVLLAELHHRVKNNLAIISGLLNLQEDATTNEEARQIIGDCKTRIMSMALVHRMLYENQELKSINIGKYTTELIHELFNSYNLSKHLVITENYDHIILPVNKSIPLGLILNEIVTNSIKYVFKARPFNDGEFAISIKKNENSTVKLLVKDNGNGFPDDFDFNSENLSLGIYLIKSLAEQIDGNVHFSNDNGAKIELNFIPN